MMSMEELKTKATALQTLRDVQRKLALSGQHKEAIRLGRKIRVHAKKLVAAYLNVNNVPDAPNAVLVREICLHLAQMGSDDKAIRSRLRLAAWSEEQDTTQKLEHAYAALPDLQKVMEVLR